MPPLTRRRAGAGEASLALRRDAYVGVGRRGSAGLLRARAAFDVRIHMYLHTTKNLARRAPSSRRRRVWTSAPTAFAPRPRGPASESSVRDSTTAWTTTSLGPPNCRTVVPPSLTYTVRTVR